MRCVYCIYCVFVCQLEWLIWRQCDRLIHKMPNKNFFSSSVRCFDMTWQLLSFDCSQFSQSNLTDKVACALYYVMCILCIDTFIVSFAFLARDFIVMPNVIKYIRSLRLLSVALKCIRNTFIWSYMTFHTTTHWILETFTIPMLFKLSSVSS